MFQIKPTTIATIMDKSSKPNNIPVNLIAAITTCGQIPEQVLREHELVKVKTTVDWQIKG